MMIICIVHDGRYRRKCYVRVTTQIDAMLYSHKILLWMSGNAMLSSALAVVETVKVKYEAKPVRGQGWHSRPDGPIRP